MSADMRKRLLMEHGEQPDWIGSEIPKLGFVPYCNQACRHFDGKRCDLLGYEPNRICEPAVARMSEALDAIEEVIK